MAKKVKSIKKPARVKAKSLPEKTGHWTNEEDELLLNTNSNNVAAILLKRSRDSAASRRFILRSKGRIGVQVETIGMKKAKSIAAGILKKEKALEKEEIPVAIIPTGIEIIDQKQILLVLNGQEIYFKNGLNKLVIKGDNVLFSVE